MKYTYIVLFFISSLLFSQNKSGIITYKQIQAISEVDSTKFDADAFKIAMDMTKAINKLEFKLEYNSKYSKFSIVDKLEKDDANVGLMMAKSVFGSEVYYYSNKEKYFIRSSDNSQVKLKDSMTWSLTSETKDISGYTCYKATSVDVFTSMNGIAKNDIVAWYCPKIPVNYAPEKFNGLPGLVLELSIGNRTYVACEINFKKEEITIDFPKGKVITEEENSAITKAKLQEMLNNR